jgi:hypothetical protein
LLAALSRPNGAAQQQTAYPQGAQSTQEIRGIFYKTKKGG